jgi:hypothetical protein
LTYLDELDDMDIILYDISYSSLTDKNKSIYSKAAEAVSLEFSNEEEYLAEKTIMIPDNFHFDDFFLDNYILFMIISFFLFP